jgi:hypothetical protein
VDEDLLALSRVGRLYLYSCHFIINIANLANASHVTIYNCQRVIDLSALSNLFYLHVYDSDATGFASLGNLRELRLEFVRNLRDEDLIHLSKVHTLKLGGCPQLQDIDCLSSVQDLSICLCRGVCDVSALGGGGVFKLVIEDIHPRATGFSHLKSVQELRLCRLPSLRNGHLSDLVQVEKLYLDSCVNVNDFGCLISSVRHLTVNNCGEIWFARWFQGVVMEYK